MKFFHVSNCFSYLKFETSIVDSSAAWQNFCAIGNVSALSYLAAINRMQPLRPWNMKNKTKELNF